MNLQGQRAWVIGASSGIGAAVAEELLQRGCSVAISARNTEALAAVSAGRMLAVPLDMNDAEALDTAQARIRTQLAGLDIVVIAAGYWQRMDADELDVAEVARHMHVNVIGMATAIAAVLPGMRAQGSGSIVGISSVAGYRGMPGAQGYGASKAAQLNLLESLRTGLRGTGVLVQTVSPGFVRTPMTSTNTFPMPFIIEPDRAARYIVDGIAKRSAEVVFPPAMAVVMKLARFVPNALWPLLMAPRGRRGRS